MRVADKSHSQRVLVVACLLYLLDIRGIDVGGSAKPSIIGMELENMVTSDEHQGGK